MSDVTNRLLCIRCRAITAVTDERELTACPECGDKSIPADADDTVTLTITTHELRILTMWASNYAQSIGGTAPAAIQGILDGIGRHTPAALSLQQEFADLRETYGSENVTIIRPGGESS